MSTEFSLPEKERTIGAYLTCYASGSGAISFTYENGAGKATGDKITYRDVKWFLDHRHPHFKAKGYMIGLVSSHPNYLLFKPVTRTGPDELSLDGHSYRYEKAAHQLWVYAMAHDGGEVKNENIRSQIRFYLEHEKELDEIIYKGGL